MTYGSCDWESRFLFVFPPNLFLRAKSPTIRWGHSVVRLRVDEFGSFHWKTAVLPKFRQRESARGQSRCIIRVSLSDQGVAIWGMSASSSAASSSSASRSPERVQLHLGTRRVPSSNRNMPVWGMLNRLAEWWKGTTQEGLSLWRITGSPTGGDYKCSWPGTFFARLPLSPSRVMMWKMFINNRKS